MKARFLAFLGVAAAALLPLAASAFVVSKTSSGKEIKWSRRSVSFYINDTAGPSGSWSAIQAAMQTWSSVPGATFQFSYAGSTTRVGGVGDYKNVCSFGYLGADGTVAENTFWYFSSGSLDESDIVFNTHFAWSLSGESGKMDVRNIATHELGHSLSLDDLYGSGDTEKTMYGFASLGEIKKATLSSDDVSGIVYLYPFLAGVTLGIHGSPVPEGGGSARITATLSGACASAVTVNLSFSGTAKLTTDYTRSATSITIPAGSLTGSITLNAVDDVFHEGDETIIIDISGVVNGTESGTQRVVVTIVDDDPAMAPPVIVQAPQSLIVTQGFSPAFMVAATGVPAPTYQWQKEGVNIIGAKAAILTLQNVTPVDSGMYTVVVTNSAGLTKASATLTVWVPPIIVQGPQSQVVTQGTATTFAVVATGTPAPSYQWQKDGVNIAGATAPLLNLANATPGDNGTYTVAVINSAGAANASATLTVWVPPTVVQGPQSLIVTQGFSPTFEVVASGIPAPAYQWQKDGVDIAGAADPILNLSNATPTDNGTYAVVVTNSAGITNASATLTVWVPPAIVQQPQSLVVTQGSNPTFEVVATGVPAPSYQWHRGGEPVPSGVGAELIITNALLSDQGEYFVVISNAAGVATSELAFLTVTIPPPEADLEVVEFSLDPTTHLQPGTNIVSLNMLVRNLGPERMGAHSFPYPWRPGFDRWTMELTFFLSQDNKLDDQDLIVGSQRIPLLLLESGAQFRYLYETNLCLPEASVGRFHLFAKAKYCGLPDPKQENNLGNARIMVLPPPPELKVNSLGPSLKFELGRTFPDSMYQLESCGDLRAGVWVPAGPPVMGSGETLILNSEINPTDSFRVYRLRVSLPPESE